MALDLRPLSLGELLDRSFSLYRRHFKTFVAIMAPPSAIAFGAAVVVQFMQEAMLTATRAGADADINRLAVVMMASVAAMFALMLAYWVAYMVALGATTAAVSELYLERAVTAAAAYRTMRGRIGALVALLVLIGVRFLGLAVIAGVLMAAAGMSFEGPAGAIGAVLVLVFLLAGAIVAFFMMLRYSLSVPALVLERVRASDAIRRSIELTRGNFLRVLVLIVFATLIAYVTLILFQGPFAMGAMLAGPGTAAAFWLNLAGALTGAVAGAISGPIMIVALALLYYDARIRQEGLDLQIMMAALDPPPPSATPAPSAALPG